MNSFKKLRYLSIIGVLISIILLYIVLSQLDWNTFIAALQAVQLQWVFACAVFILLGVAIRSLRWNIISGHPVSEYRYFWKSLNLGYFANMIYPARAGEIIRMIAIHHYVGMPQGKAISGVIIDRIADGLILGVFILLLITLHDTRFSWGITFMLFIMFFVLLSLFLVSFILWGDKFHGKIFFLVRKGPEILSEKIKIWYFQAFEGVQTLRDPFRLLIILLLSIIAFLTDAVSFYLLTIGFGWELPLTAAIYLAIFIQAGSILPSAPGYVGIYQVACVLALRMFGIDDSAAIAYSLVIQVLAIGMFIVIGGVIAIRDGFSLYKINNNTTPIYKG